MKTSLLFTLALALVAAGCGKSTQSSTSETADATRSDYTSPTVAGTAGNATSTSASISNDLRSAAHSTGNAISSAAGSVVSAARMAEWKLNASDIQADLTANREIVRTKQQGAGAPTGTSDADVLESMVKSRIQADANLAALKLEVDAKKGGEVSLSGKAHSAEEVGRAIAMALDTEGVTRVSSKIKLDK